MPGKTAKSAPLAPFGLSGMTALVRAATLSCENAGKSQKCTQDRESSGESRLKPGLLSRAAASRAALARCRGMDGERMHAALELGDKGFVDHAVALEPALPAERLSHDIYPEMRFPALAMPGVPGVLVGFVHHLEPRGVESPGQLFRDAITPGHGLGITGSEPAGQSTLRPQASKCRGFSMRPNLATLIGTPERSDEIDHFRQRPFVRSTIAPIYPLCGKP
jgi:hypothetical protein